MSHLILRFGLIAGVAISAFMLLPILIFGLRSEWMKLAEILGYTWMVLAMSTVYFAIRNERQRRGGHIPFSTAFGLATGVSIVAGALFGIATWLVYEVAGDRMVPELLAYYTAQINESGADAANIAQQLAQLEGMKPFLYNYPLQAAVMFATVFVIGLIVGIFASWFLSRRHTPA
jgi:hypothetical protein